MTWMKTANPFADEDLGKCQECGKAICVCIQDKPDQNFPMNESKGVTSDLESEADPMSSEEWHDYLGSEELTQKLDKMTKEELREFQDGLSDAEILIDDLPSAYQGQTGLGKNPNKQRIIELAQSILPLIKELRELIG